MAWQKKITKPIPTLSPKQMLNVNHSISRSRGSSASVTLTLLFSMGWTKTSTKTDLLARGRNLAKVHPAGLGLQVKNEAEFCIRPFASKRLLQPGEEFLQFIIFLFRVREVTRKLVFTLPQWSAIKKQHALGENWALNIPQNLCFLTKRAYF